MQIDLPLHGQPANMLQGLDSSDLVVGMHYRNEYAVRTDGPLQVGDLHQPLRIEGQVGYGKALFLQAAAGLQYGRMLNAADDDMPAQMAALAGYALEGQVVRLRPTEVKTISYGSAFRKQATFSRDSSRASFAF